MKWLLLTVMMILTSCSPVQEPSEYQTKYPDAPTMQSAEDAATGKLFKD
jgi:hypothetical protein